MRRCAILLFLALLALPGYAAKRLTVEQFDQLLTTFHGKSDSDIALRLTDIELTQRPTPAALDRWQTQPFGPEAKRALAVIANCAVFLNLPPADLPASPAPGRDEQRRMLGLTVGYVTKTIHQLPNFFATRVTSHFEDQPEGYGGGGTVFVPAEPMRFTDTTSATVLYRDGAEKLDASATKVRGPSRGLATSGEFGPVLAIVLVDAARSTLAWSHWEPGTSAPLAVFSYSVPSEKSHYEVSFCCLLDQNGSSGMTQPFRQLSGYHGEITVDPATGAILRLTAQADLKSTDPLIRADIMVEYGPVEIGGQSYILPLRSVSISMGHVSQSSDVLGNRPGRQVQYSPGRFQTLLNQVSFTDYHLFRAGAQLLTAGADLPADHSAMPPASSSADTSTPAPSAESAPPTVAANASSPKTPRATTSTDAEKTEAPAPQPSAAATETAAAPAPPENPPPQPASFDVPSLNNANAGQVTIFKANSEAVVVDVVVTKGRDEPLTGLRKEDFQIIEDGKPQAVDHFEEHGSEPVTATALPPMPPNVFTNQPVAPPGDSVNILLLDSLNTSQQDQAFVHQQILSFLKNMDPGARVAIFALGAKLRFVQGFTDDPAILRAALTDKRNLAKPDTQQASRTRSDDVSDAQEVQTLTDMENGMVTAAVEALQKAQSEFANYQGDQRALMTLAALRHIAQYLAGIPGRKNLIWFAGSFPVTIFPSAQEKQLTIAQQRNGRAIRDTADQLTLSKVAIYPVSAVGAAINNTVDASADLSTGMKTTPMPDYTDANTANASHTLAMEQLATDTGGEAIFGTNDLTKALTRALHNGSRYYTLVYAPTNKDLDGKYRRIEIKLNGVKAKLSYRRGYYADPVTRDLPVAGNSTPGNSSQTATISDEANGQPDPLRPLLNRGLPSATQLLYGVRVLPATQQPTAAAAVQGGNDELAGPLTRYTLDFLIRWQDVDLTLTPQGTHRGQVQLGVVAYTRDGKPVNWIGVTQRMNINAETYAAIQRSGIPAHLEIDLPRQQDLYLVTGVYDWASQQAGTLEVPLKFPSPQAASTKSEPTQTKPN